MERCSRRIAKLGQLSVVVADRDLGVVCRWLVRVVRGRLIKTRESFSRRMRRRARREETSLNLFRSGLQRERGALVTPSCTVSAVTAPPALYYESNLSRREATASWAGVTEVRGLRGWGWGRGRYLTPELIACSLSCSPGKRGRTVLRTLTVNGAQRRRVREESQLFNRGS